MPSLFPEDFDRIRFREGKTIMAQCRTGRLTAEGRLAREAVSRGAPAPTGSRDRLLAGVPGADIERILGAAPGDAIGRGKFDRPESSAALAANASGFFLHRAPELASLNTGPKRPRAQSARLSPSSKRTRLASRHGDSERSSGGSSSVARRAGRLEVELRRM